MPSLQRPPQVTPGSGPVGPEPGAAYLKDVRRALDSIQSHGHQPWRIFEDWVGLMHCAFLRDDPAYLKIMEHYKRGNDRAEKGKRPADYFAAALAGLMSYMRATNNEALGPLYMEYAANHYRGQFFTPDHVARLMAMITMGPDPQPANILDPACGAGIQLVMAAKQMSVAAANESTFSGVDVDINCARMAALNLMFFNLEGFIVWGDSIRLEAHGGWHTRRSLVWGGSMRAVSKEQAQAWMEGPFKEAKTKTEATEQGQMLLFGAPEKEKAA